MAYNKFENLKKKGISINDQSYTKFSNAFDPFESGFNFIAQFIGNFTGDVFVSEDGKSLIFVITDNKDNRSEFYHMASSYDRVDGQITPGGNTWQKYIWTEPYNVNWYYNELNNGRRVEFKGNYLNPDDQIIK